MSERTTWQSKTKQLETDTCIYCGQEVYVGESAELSDEIPSGVPVVIGEGGNMTVDQTGSPFLDYRIPEVIIKWFSRPDESVNTELQHMCPSCAEEVYDYSR